jgi:hypothetical protein
MQLEKIKYEDLNARQKENYNYQIVSAIFATYGYLTMRLSDDWTGADFIAQHIKHKTIYKVQLKGGFTIAKKYGGKELYMCWRNGEDWYLCPHDKMVEILKENNMYTHTPSWTKQGLYYNGKMGKQLEKLFQEYLLY